MRIGISISSSYDVQDAREGARWMVERAQAANEAGLDSLFIGDHHVTPSPYYQNTPMLGRMLAEWQSGPAGALYLLPFRHPVLLAEEIATLAALCPDRFIMQCGIGYGDHEFHAFGINPKHRPSRFEESLDIMRRLWAGERVDHDGRWHLQDAHISPTPPVPIEVWIGGSADPAIDRAARLGDGWLAAPGLTPAQARTSMAIYLTACEVHNRQPGVTAIRRDVYVGGSQAQVDDVKRRLQSNGHRGFPPSATIVGTVESVAEAFQSLKSLGYSDVIVRNIVSEQDEALACIHRLAAVKAVVG